MPHIPQVLNLAMQLCVIGGVSYVSKVVHGKFSCLTLLLRRYIAAHLPGLGFRV
jgi:hypothetical protein